MFELCLEVKVRFRFGYGRWETSFVPVVLPVLCLLVNIILVLALKSWASLWLLPGEMAQLGHHEAPGLGETGAAPYTSVAPTVPIHSQAEMHAH